MSLNENQNPGIGPVLTPGGPQVPPAASGPGQQPSYSPYAGSVGTLIVDGFRLYRRNFWSYFVIMLVAQGVVVLCVGFWQGLALANLPGPLGNVNLKVPLMIGGGIFSFAVSSVANTAAQGTLTMAVTAHLLAQRMTGPEAFMCVLPSMLRLLGVSFLGAFAILLGFVFCIVPGIILYFGFFLMGIIVVVEGRRPVDALRRSWDLMYHKTERGFFSLRANSARAAVIFLYSFIIGLAVSLGGAALFVPIAALRSAGFASIPPAAVTLARQAVQGVATAFVMPLAAVPMILLYYDIRKRFEGLDLAAAVALVADPVEPTDSGGSWPQP